MRNTLWVVGVSGLTPTNESKNFVKQQWKWNTIYSNIFYLKADIKQNVFCIITYFIKRLPMLDTSFVVCENWRIQHWQHSTVPYNTNEQVTKNKTLGRISKILPFYVDNLIIISCHVVRGSNAQCCREVSTQDHI